MIQVIHRALNVLELLAEDPQKGRPLGQIAQSLGLHKGTCGNILRTLVERGYVERTEDQRAYRLGPMLRQVATGAAGDAELVAAAHYVLQNLTQNLNETSLLGVVRGSKRITLDSVPCDQDLQVNSREVRDVYETASGRVVLAYFSEERFEAFLRRTGPPDAGVWPGVQSRAELRAALSTIAEEELAVTRSPKHIVGLAVPVRKQDDVVASVSVYLPEVRYEPARQEAIIEALREAGRQITHRLQRLVPQPPRAG